MPARHAPPTHHPPLYPASPAFPWLPSLRRPCLPHPPFFHPACLALPAWPRLPGLARLARPPRLPRPPARPCPPCPARPGCLRLAALPRHTSLHLAPAPRRTRLLVGPVLPPLPVRGAPFLCLRAVPVVLAWPAMSLSCRTGL